MTLTATLVMALGLGGVAQPAHATEVETCANVPETWSFPNPLPVTGTQNGTASLTYLSECAFAIIGGADGVEPLRNGGTTFTYNGNLEAATLTNGVLSGVIIGGSIAVLSGPGMTSIHVLAPIPTIQVPPQESEAAGVGVFTSTS